MKPEPKLITVFEVWGSRHWSTFNSEAEAWDYVNKGLDGTNDALDVYRVTSQSVVGPPIMNPFSRPPLMLHKAGFYWLLSERSSKRGVGQWFGGAWFLVNEIGPISESGLNRRGWVRGQFIGSEEVE